MAYLASYRSGRTMANGDLKPHALCTNKNYASDERSARVIKLISDIKPRAMTTVSLTALTLSVWIRAGKRGATVVSGSLGSRYLGVSPAGVGLLARD